MGACKRCGKPLWKNGILTTTGGAKIQQWICINRHTSREAKRLPLSERFPAADEKRWVDGKIALKKFAPMRSSDEVALKALALLALGLSYQEVAPFVGCTVGTLRRVSEWFRRAKPRLGVLAELASLFAQWNLPDAAWRLRALVDAMEKDHQAHLFQKGNLFLRGMMDDVSDHARKICTTAAELDESDIFIEAECTMEHLDAVAKVLDDDLEVALPSGRHEADYHMRQRAYDRFVRGEVETNPAMILNITGMNPVRTKRNRFEPEGIRRQAHPNRSRGKPQR
jgi:hypothetical protein